LRVLQVEIKVQDEKFPSEARGPRSLVDVPPGPLAEGEVKESFGWWVYNFFKV
jgi:hypothetical protein